MHPGSSEFSTTRLQTKPKPRHIRVPLESHHKVRFKFKSVCMGRGTRKHWEGDREYRERRAPKRVCFPSSHRLAKWSQRTRTPTHPWAWTHGHTPDRPSVSGAGRWKPDQHQPQQWVPTRGNILRCDDSHVLTLFGDIICLDMDFLSKYFLFWAVVSLDKWHEHVLLL